MAKEILTYYGPQAKDGDYVIVAHAFHNSGATTHLAKVFNGKAYTGVNVNRYGSHPKYLHKASAVIVVPESYVSEERKAAIEEDIRMSTAPKAKKAVSGDD